MKDFSQATPKSGDYPAKLVKLDYVDRSVHWLMLLHTMGDWLVTVITPSNDPLLFFFEEQRTWDCAIPDEDMVSIINNDFEFSVSIEVDDDGVITAKTLTYVRTIGKTFSIHAYPDKVVNALIDCCYDENDNLTPSLQKALEGESHDKRKVS